MVCFLFVYLFITWKGVWVHICVSFCNLSALLQPAGSHWICYSPTHLMFIPPSSPLPFFVAYFLPFLFLLFILLICYILLLFPSLFFSLHFSSPSSYFVFYFPLNFLLSLSSSYIVLPRLFLIQLPLFLHALCFYFQY